MQSSLVGDFNVENLLAVIALLLDWGDPGQDEQSFDLTAYIGRLCRALAAARQQAGRPVQLLGYCMGALESALAAAPRRAGTGTRRRRPE